MEIKLVVIRTADIETLSKFYSGLGINFDYHKHDKSPFHYSAKIDKTVLEIYPLMKDQSEADRSLRLGIGIDNFDSIINQLKANRVKFISEAVQTEFGIMAIVEDPDGRKVELYK